MALLAQQLLNGITLGGAYALVAAGLNLVIGIMGILNFAQGSFYVIGGYVAYTMIVYVTGSYPLAVVAALAAAGLVGYLLHRGVLRLFVGRDPLDVLIATLAVAVVLEQTAVVVWGANTVTFSSPLSELRIAAGGINTTGQRLAIIGAAVAAFVLVNLWINRSAHGRTVRATAQNRTAAMLMGINVHQVESVVFTVGAILTGAAAVLMVPIVTIDPFWGLWALFKGFVVVVLAGLGNVFGTLYAGLLLGVVEALVGGYYSAQFSEAVGFVLIILVLQVRKEGIFGGSTL